MATFDANDQAHQQWRTQIDRILKLDGDPAIELDTIDLTADAVHDIA